MTALFDAIGNNHGVTQEQVRESINKYRYASLDLAGIISFALLYGLAARSMVRCIWRRFPLKEGWLIGVIATAIISAVFSMAGVLLSEMWTFEAETLRVGNGHLSYREDRIPWKHHRLGIFAGAVIIFWVAGRAPLGLQY